jgi:hypothetical protein
MISIKLHQPFSASPFVRELSRTRRRQRQTEWKQPEDNWNITTLPRSILPHLENKNFTHSLPAPGNIQYRTIDSDERLLERFHEIKVNKFPLLLPQNSLKLFLIFWKFFRNFINFLFGFSHPNNKTFAP